MQYGFAGIRGSAHRSQVEAGVCLPASQAEGGVPDLSARALGGPQGAHQPDDRCHQGSTLIALDSVSVHLSSLYNHAQWLTEQCSYVLYQVEIVFPQTD